MWEPYGSYCLEKVRIICHLFFKINIHFLERKDNISLLIEYFAHFNTQFELFRSIYKNEK